MGQFFEKLNWVVESLVHRGTRHRVEKLATLGGFLVLTVGSVAWAFSPGEDSEELVAEFDATRLNVLDSQAFHLSNLGETDWRDVRVVINRKYLWTADTVKAGEQRTLEPRDFDYFYHIPRPWGESSWEKLEGAKRPETKAPASIDVELVELRARQGGVDLKPGPDGRAKSAGVPR